MVDLIAVNEELVSIATWSMPDAGVTPAAKPAAPTVFKKERRFMRSPLYVFSARHRAWPDERCILERVALSADHLRIVDLPSFL